MVVLILGYALPKSTQTTRLITYYYATSRIKVIQNITTTDYKIKS